MHQLVLSSDDEDDIIIQKQHKEAVNGKQQGIHSSQSTEKENKETFKKLECNGDWTVEQRRQAAKRKIDDVVLNSLNRFSNFAFQKKPLEQQASNIATGRTLPPSISQHIQPYAKAGTSNTFSPSPSYNATYNGLMQGQASQWHSKSIGGNHATMTAKQRAKLRELKVMGGQAAPSLPALSAPFRSPLTPKPKSPKFPHYPQYSKVAAPQPQPKKKKLRKASDLLHNLHTAGGLSSGKSGAASQPKQAVVISSDEGEGEKSESEAEYESGDDEQEQKSEGKSVRVQEEPVEGVLERCQELSHKLKGLVEKEMAEGSPTLITHAFITTAVAGLTPSLKPYQIIGINFLLILARQNISGAILADDMGLGKTAQSITFLATLAATGTDHGPHIIVVPASLLDNWLRELKSWAPALRVVPYYDSDRAAYRREYTWRAKRREMRGGEESDSSSDCVEIVGSESESGEEGEGEGSDQEYVGESGGSEDGSIGKKGGGKRERGVGHKDFDVLLTSYNVFSKDSAEQLADRKFFRSIKWSYMVLDEGHAIKSHASKRSRELQRLSAQCCKARLLLSGTPLQNNLSELVNLLVFLVPEMFVSRHDWETVEELREAKGDTAYESVEYVKQLLQPFFLRRLKADVAMQLPEKVNTVERIDMAGAQGALYRSIADSIRSELAKVTAGRKGRKKGGGGGGG